MQESIYTGHFPCPTLTPGELCFRCRRYFDGEVTDKFHEHVRAFRISNDSAWEVLRALVGHAAEWPNTWILRSRLNSRSKNPERWPPLTHVVEYPEKGVVRQIVSEGNAWAWVDRVVSKDKFRTSDQKPPGTDA
jgi:hypothetical protein